MKSRGRILHLERALGFATELGISRQTSRLKGSPLVGLLEEIDLIKKDYEYCSTDDIRSSRDLQASTDRIFRVHGREVWPDEPLRAQADWLARANLNDSDSPYQQELYYSNIEHRETLYQLFHSLVEEKTIKYRDNQHSLKKRKARLRVSFQSDEVVPSPSRAEGHSPSDSELTDFEEFDTETTSDEAKPEHRISPTAAMSYQYRTAPSSARFAYNPLKPDQRRESDEVIHVGSGDRRDSTAFRSVNTPTVNPAHLALDEPNGPARSRVGGSSTPQSEAQAGRQKRGRQDTNSPSGTLPKRAKESASQTQPDVGSSNNIGKDHPTPAAPPAPMSRGSPTTNNVGQQNRSKNNALPGGSPAAGNGGNKPAAKPLARITINPGPSAPSPLRKDALGMAEGAAHGQDAGKAGLSDPRSASALDGPTPGQKGKMPTTPGSASQVERGKPTGATDGPTSRQIGKMPVMPESASQNASGTGVPTVPPQGTGKTPIIEQPVAPNQQGDGATTGDGQPGSPQRQAEPVPAGTDTKQPPPPPPPGNGAMPPTFELPKRLKAYVYTSREQISPRVAILDYRVGIEAFFKQLDKKLGKKLLASGKTVEEFEVKVRKDSGLPSTINVTVVREDGEAEWEFMACELVKVEGGEDFNVPKLDIYLKVSED